MLRPPCQESGPIYSSLLNAYNTAINGDTIQSQDVVLTESPNLNRAICVIIMGGYNCAYSTTGSGTVLAGTLNIIDGSVTIDNLIIQ